MNLDFLSIRYFSALYFLALFGLVIFNNNLAAMDEPGVSPESITTPTIDLLAYYSFDGDANDQSGNDYHGQVNGPFLTSGASGQAYDFDGVNDYIAINNLNFSQAGAIESVTISAWIQTDFVGTDRFDNWAIIDFDRSEYFCFFVRGDNGTVGFSTRDDLGRINDFYGNGSVNDGNWHHVVAVFDGTDKIVYVDGVEDSRVNNVHGGRNLGSGVTRYGFIGDGSEADTANGLRNYSHYNGLLDEIKVYSGALNANEITQEFESIDLPTVGTGLLARYRFEDDVLDTSGNGYDGEIHGPEYVAGKVGQAIRLNGTSDFIAISNLNFSDAGSLEELTVCAWVNTDYSGGNWYNNWAVVDFDRNENFSLFVRGDNGRLGFSTAASNGGFQDFFGNSPVNDGLWHHVCAVYNGRDKILYVDGTPDGKTGNAHGGLGLGTGRVSRYGFIGDGSEAEEFNGARNNMNFEGTVDEISLFDRALSRYEIASLIQEADVEPEMTCPEGAHWSNAASWPDHVPVDGESVTIPSGTTMVLDTDTAQLAGLTINGTLRFCNQDLALSADWILVHGEFHIGSESEPFTHQATLTLTGDDPDELVMGTAATRGIMVMGGTLELHGTPPIPAWTKINRHVNAGESVLPLMESVDWLENDHIVLAPTDFYGVSQSESFQINEILDDELSINTPVSRFRWGLMQYATNDGMSLTPDESMVPPAPLEQGPTPLELDERAEVGNLSRNIVIQSVEDSLWQEDGFGAHVMIMMLSSEVRIDGVEFRRVGQAGVLGRYPFHWHRLSYDDAGTELGDATGHYIRNCSIHNSSNRAVTIHGTNGVLVQNNVCYDILGHAIFFEDAVEQRNTVEDNLVLRVRFPEPENALKRHDIAVQTGITTGSSGIWVSNPNNTVRNNTLADSEGFGLWMAFPRSPVGPSANVPILPFRMPFGNFDGNTMHSNRLRGVMLDNSEIDDEGNVQALQYASTTDGQNLSWPFDNLQRFSIYGWTLWKNGGGNFWNRVVWPTYAEFVSADGEGKFFSGSGSEGLITRSLIVGSSLNDFSPRPNPFFGPPVALATYHSAFDMRENVIVNFPFVENQTSGAFATDDYYIRPVEKGHIRNPNNLLINTHPGYRSDAALDENIAFNFAQGFTYYVFAGALWDPHGTWASPGTWSVYDIPFLTHNASCSTIEPESQNAASCDGDYYGVNHFILDQGNMPWDDLMAIDVTRFDENNPDTVVDTWSVDGAQTGWALAHMRHFAARRNGIYLLDFPDSPIPEDVSVDISNMHEPSETFVLGIRFSGTEDAQVYSTTYTYPGYFNDGAATAPDWASKHNYTEVSGRQAVISSTGETFWQDHSNNIVWISVSAGDLVQFSASAEEVADEFSDFNLYNEFHLRVW